MRRFFTSTDALLRLGALATLVAVSSSMASGAPVPRQTLTPGEVTLQPTQDQYVVQKGDTLWDISEKIVGSPWLWPKVWSYNPEITNPHWIYPGDIIRFTPPSGPLPAVRVAQGTQAATDVSPAAATNVRPEPEGPKIKEVTTVPPGSLDPERFVGVFATRKQLQAAGRLTDAVESKILLSTGDEVFVTWPRAAGPRPEPGQRFMVYRTVRQIQHPRTKKHWGYLTQVTGFARLRAHESERSSRAVLEKTVKEIERGQYLTPVKDDLNIALADPVPAASDVEGVVLAVEGQTTRLVGQHELVFVDRGVADGLRAGNALRVLAQTSPFRPGQPEGPLTAVGKVMVLEAREDSATCLVLQTRREIPVGAKVRAITQ